MRVLLVEDDAQLAAALETGLHERGWQVVWVTNTASARPLLPDRGFDLIILDVMLPGGSGFDLCRELRSAGIPTPVLMLTARDGVDDRVAGLDVGADDYLVKPFAFRELLARMRALTRRPRDLETDVIEIADLRIDLGRHQVSRSGGEIPLTAKEFALLACLARARGAVLDRARITAQVWDDNHDPFTNVLEVLIRRLRRKIDDGYVPHVVHTVRGTGYRLGV